MKRTREPEKRTDPSKRQRRDAFPYTPYPLQPSDSPSNPFKRKTNVDSLPSVSSFRKHIPLRFQLYRCGFDLGSVHRIVQVPLNYSFTHLRALIAWLFDVPAKCTNGKAGEEDYLFEVKTDITMESTRSKPGMIKRGETSVKVSNAKNPSSGDADELESEDDVGDNIDDNSGDWFWADEEGYTLDHVWATGLQADRGIIYHHYPSTQVHITVNSTKLPRRRGKSNVPYIFSAQGRVDLSPRPLPRPLFTQSILHALSSSPTGPLRPRLYETSHRPSRKRATTSSPNPFSLTDDDLSDTENDSPPNSFNRSHPFFDQPTRPRKNPTILVDDSDDEERFPTWKGIHSADSDEEEEQDDEDKLNEAYDRPINPDHWNESHYAFGRYLLSFLDPRGRSYAHLDDEYFEEKIPYDPFENDDDDEGVGDETYVEEGSMEQIELEYDEENGSTPDLTSSSTRCSSSLPPSSPPTQAFSSSPSWHHLASLDGNDGDDDDPSPPSSIDPLSLSPNSSLSLHPSIIASHYPNKKYTFTPAPPLARKHRVQLERLERRLERGKKGMYLCAYDEAVDEKDELDELDEEEEDEDEECVRPVLKEGEIWDPFGDEAEV